MNLVVDIAWTHVRARARQTVVAVVGVAIGVGFSIMMAALMQGSQDDFIRQLVNALPHITISDERREPPAQPAETEYAAVQIYGLTPETRRRGIKNPLARMASLGGWIPGAVAPSVKVQGIIRYASRDIGTSILGIDPQQEPRVSNLVNQMRQGTLASLPCHQRHRPRRSPGREDRRPSRRQRHRADQRGRTHQRAGGRLLSLRRPFDRRGHVLRPRSHRPDPCPADRTGE